MPTVRDSIETVARTQDLHALPVPHKFTNLLDRLGRIQVFRSIFIFFFNDTATTEIYPLSLHDALPISRRFSSSTATAAVTRCFGRAWNAPPRDRKSTRLNSSHLGISYAVFCLKKKKKKNTTHTYKKKKKKK